MENPGDVPLPKQGIETELDGHFIMALCNGNFKHVIKTSAVVVVNQLQRITFSHDKHLSFQR